MKPYHTANWARADGRIVVQLPCDVRAITALLADTIATHPDARLIDTGRYDVVVIELGATT